MNRIVRKPRIHIPPPTVSPFEIRRRAETKEVLQYLEALNKKQKKSMLRRFF